MTLFCTWPPDLNGAVDQRSHRPYSDKLNVFDLHEVDVDIDSSTFGHCAGRSYIGEQVPALDVGGSCAWVCYFAINCEFTLYKAISYAPETERCIHWDD